MDAMPVILDKDLTRGRSAFEQWKEAARMEHDPHTADPALPRPVKAMAVRFSLHLLEQKAEIGGLCLTRVSPNGFKYEPFGAHTFHTGDAQVREFVTRFGPFNDYVHRKGIILHGKLFPFPLPPSVFGALPEAARIRRELARRPASVDMTNFETACRSR